MEAKLASFKVVINEKNIFITETTLLPEKDVKEVFKDIETQQYVKTILRESKVAFSKLHTKLQKELSSLS